VLTLWEDIRTWIESHELFVLPKLTMTATDEQKLSPTFHSPIY